MERTARREQRFEPQRRPGRAVAVSPLERTLVYGEQIRFVGLSRDPVAGERQVVLGVSLLAGAALFGAEPREGKRPNALQQRVTAGVRHAHQGLVDQIRQLVEDVVRGEHTLGGVEVEATTKHRALPQRTPRLGFQQLPRPIDGGLQRRLARGA